MRRFLLHHRHTPDECGTVFASFKDGTSPLRGKPAFASCLYGGHEIWWVVDAGSAPQALELLPPYVAQRTQPVPIRKVPIP